jgi:CheY-like chemotaxis protein
MADERPARAPGVSEKCFPPGSAPRPPQHILLVDDDRELLTCVAKFVRHLGYEVTLAGDGREALEIFRAGCFELVVTDLQMPVLDGLELLENIKALSRRTPVVIITGQSDIGVEQAVGDAGASALLHKPFDLGELEDTLHQVFSFG